MLGLISSLLTKEKRAEEEVAKELQRSSWGSYLPWIAYDEDTGAYLTADNCAGYIVECSPLYFAASKTADVLQGILSMPLPENSVAQFILHADEYVAPALALYRRLHESDSPLMNRATEEYLKFLSQAAVAGFDRMGNVPLKRFRLFATFKVPLTDDGKLQGNQTFEEMRDTFNERLQGAMLFPRVMEPPALIEWARRMLNEEVSELTADAYDDTIPIRDQIVKAETHIEKHSTSIQFGKKFFRCATPKTFPRTVNLLQQSELVGGFMGVNDDGNQPKTPFLYCMNIIFGDLKSYLHSKCNLMLRQETFGSWAGMQNRRKEEFLHAVDTVERGVSYARIIPTMWVWGPEEKTQESIQRVKRIWEAKGYVMQEDRGILPILHLLSMPLGLYATKKNISLLDRDFVAPIDTIAHTLPVQADFAGGGIPRQTYIGRKGQLITIDMFDKHAQNHNFLVFGSSGAGKTFFMNDFIRQNYASGALFRMFDIGMGYEKPCNMVDGKFLRFNKDSKICLNPFTNMVNIDDDMSFIKGMFAQMLYSGSKQMPEQDAENVYTLLGAAVKWAWETEGNDAEIDTVGQYFQEFKKHGAEFDLDCSEREECSRVYVELAYKLYHQMRPFMTDGAYGKWFNGRATFDLTSDRFVVLELEDLKPKKEIFPVVLIQLINMTTKELYERPPHMRDVPIFVGIDEAHQMLPKASDMGNMELMMTAKFLEDGYRRARKYKGSFSIISQSPSDLCMWGGVGRVIYDCSAFKFLLESTGYDAAAQGGYFNYDPFTVQLLESIRRNGQNYSEIFADTPYGKGVIRLMADRFNYFMNTSDPTDNKRLFDRRNAGLAWVESIEAELHKGHK